SGVGSSLIRSAVRQFGPETSVSLIANEASPAARFYESLGLAQHRFYKFYCGQVEATEFS
ncbi:MAG: hypothetical protein JXQ73_11660, partial [Phycisphaerae bacterium]|nr:hypothetical protein [Phycisphaerae bacterium]